MTLAVIFESLRIKIDLGFGATARVVNRLLKESNIYSHVFLYVCRKETT